MSRKFNAILGLGALAAFGFASSAFAQCPTGPVPPWTAQTQTQGVVAIATGGFDGTSCRMTSTLNAGASSFASAIVRDETPADEPSYRAQFLVDADLLTGMGSFEGATIFTAQSAAAHQSTNVLLRVVLRGGANKSLNFIAADEGETGNISQVTVPLVAGVNRVEFHLTAGAAGELRIWANAPVGPEPGTTATIANLNNVGWVGVDAANLGVAAGNSLFRTNQATRAVSFDEFDSRRTSYIGQ